MKKPTKKEIEALYEGSLIDFCKPKNLNKLFRFYGIQEYPIKVAVIHKYKVVIEKWIEKEKIKNEKEGRVARFYPVQTIRDIETGNFDYFIVLMGKDPDDIATIIDICLMRQMKVYGDE